MKNSIIVYEWDLESFDLETGDIEDHDFSDKCPGLPTDPQLRLVLVRDIWRKITKEECERWHKNFAAAHFSEMTLENRQWAYVENEKLPACFDGGSKVPARFHKELAKHAKGG